MSLWAIVPIKPLRLGKSRLSPTYSEEERANLNRFLLMHTLERLKQVKKLEKIMVVSRDPEALSIARDFGAITLLERGNPGLNMALTRASLVAKAYKVRGILIVPVDLPLLEPQEVSQMIARMNGKPCVVLAPDRRREGTNAMLVAPPDLIPFQFGHASFARHCELAKQAGIDLQIFEAHSLALDLDLPEDLEVMGTTLDFYLEDAVTESFLPF